MLLAASESAVTKKPRLRFTMRRSSSESPFGSFQSWMSRLMLISCGIQWLAQAAMYFSQAHLYLNGTSWLTSAFELMIFFSSTVTRRNGLSATAGRAGRAGGATSGARFSKFSMSFSGVLVGSHRLREQQRAQAGFLGHRQRGEFGPVLAPELAHRRRTLRRGGERELVGGDVQVPLGADDRQPFAVFGVLLEQLRVRQVCRLAEL